jgi:hypothetical protein
MTSAAELRAMREARFARARAYAAGQAPPVSTPKAAPAPARRAAAAPVAPVEPAVAEALCGHRNMSGRTCTREQGHPQKNHRYS